MKKLLQLFIILLPVCALAAPESMPERVRGEGPFQRLILRDVIVVNGEGAPPVGPMDVLIKGNKIAEIRSLGLINPVPETNRIKVEPGDKVMELDGHYRLPCFIDLHAHVGGDAQGMKMPLRQLFSQLAPDV